MASEPMLSSLAQLAEFLSANILSVLLYSTSAAVDQTKERQWNYCIFTQHEVVDEVDVILVLKGRDSPIPCTVHTIKIVRNSPVHVPPQFPIL